MKRYLASYFEPKLDLEGRLNSEIEVCLWEIEEDRLKNPFFTRVSVPFFIPTRPIKEKDNEKAEDAFNRCKEFYIEQYKQKATKIKEKLDNIKNKSSKKYKSNKEKLNIIEDFLQSREEKIWWERKRYSMGKSFYNFHIPFFNKEGMELFLSSYLPKSDGRFSVNKNLAAKLNFPFFIVEEDNNGYKIKNKEASLDLLLQQPGLALDFETHNWEKKDIPEDYHNMSDKDLEQVLVELGKNRNDIKEERRDQLLRDIEEIHNELKNERITVASISSLDEDYNYLVTTLDFPEDYINVDNPLNNQKERFEVIKTSNQYKLIEKVNELFEKFQPFYVYGHNQMKFDYNKAIELTENFKVGVERRGPKLISQIPNGYIQQNILQGRVDIDPCIYSQLYMSNPDNRLDTVFKTITGKETKKTLSHGDLIKKTIVAERGIKKDDRDRAAKEILYYAAQDAMKSWIIGNELKKEHLLLSKAFNSLPARVDTCSPRKISCDYHEHDYLKRKGFYRFIPFEREKITPNEKAQQILNTEGELHFQNFDLNSFLEKAIAEKRKKGYQHHKCLPCSTEEKTDEAKLFHLEDIILSEATNNGREDIIEKRTSWLELEKGLFDCNLIMVNPVVESLKDFIEHDERIKAIYDEAQKSPPLKRLRYYRALTKVLEFPVFKLLATPKWHFKDDFKEAFPKGMDNLEDKLYKNIGYVSELFMNNKVINFSKDLYLIKKDRVSNYLLERLEKKGLAFKIGRARALSGDKGTMIGTTGDYDFMEGFSPADSNKGEKFPFQAEFYADFLEELIYNQNKRGALEVFKDYLKSFIEDNFSESSFMVEKESKRHFYEFSSAYNAPMKKQFIEQKAKKGDTIKYTYTKEELYDKLFGYSPDKFSPRKGKISKLLCWAFNIDNSVIGRNKKEVLRAAIEEKNYEGLNMLLETS